ncbi:MAG: response regulator transcription factor [Alphaproteobacteria bacterium]|nr:response regulator transcription factor [Alphaproteobacteria bacterium]
MAKSTTVLLADDHALFRQGIRLLLADCLKGATLVEADGFDSALEALQKNGSATLIVMDLRMPGMAGANSLRALREAYPEAKLVVLSASEARADILEALGAGVHGYIPKTALPAEIGAAIKYVLDGGVYVPPLLSRAADDPLPPAGEAKPAPANGPALDLQRFTPRQRDVLRLLAAGKSNKEIARQLDLAEGTVKIHLAAVFRALNARNRTEAVVLAGKFGS